ncbi:MAG: hypothetical protein U0821_00585 [Chloroflexota bacterium]
MNARVAAISLLGGCVYFLVVFGAGMVLGTVRTLLVAPRLGEAAAVALELPIMLAISWIASSKTVRYFGVPGTTPARVLTGGLALLLLLCAEVGVSVIAFGRTVSAHFADYLETGTQLGLLGQVAFALFPLVQARRARATGPPGL